jgi:hypothetical protein
MSENPERTEKCKEKNLQEENNFHENSSNFNWDEKTLQLLASTSLIEKRIQK